MPHYLGSLVRTRRPRRSSSLFLLLIVACLVGGIYGAVAAGDARRDEVLYDGQRAFDRSAADLSASIATSLRRNADLSASSSAFVASSDDLNNLQFQSWYDQGAFERYPGLVTVGYIERVAHADLEVFVAKLTADRAMVGGSTDFSLVPPGPREEYCLTRLTADGVAAVPVELPAGLDMCALPGISEVFTQAADMGDFVVMPLPDAESSPEFAPFGEGEAKAISGTAFVVVAPVQAPDLTPGDPEAVRGWIISAFDGPGIVSELPGLDPDVDLSLSWRDAGETAVIAERSLDIDAPVFESVETFDADGEWTMTVRRSAADAYAAARNQQLVVTGAITVFTILVLAFLWLVVGARNRALRLVDEKTEQLRFQALHDSLTGLPNRALILDRTGQMLHRARRGDFSPVAMFLDIDNFKTINDTLGHAAGDRLLRTVAERLHSVVRHADTVGRLGGDEFVVLADRDIAPDWTETLAQRILDAVAEPILLDGLGSTPLTIGVSIGIAIGDRPDAGTLLRDADVALYEAKAAGKGSFVIFEPKMQVSVREKFELEMDLFGPSAPSSSTSSTNPSSALQMVP